MTLDDYNGVGDLGNYFPGSVLPYVDKAGNQRMGFIENFEDGKFIYRPNIKGSDQWSTRTFRKNYDEFDYQHNLTGKMVQHQGGAVWVDTVGTSTMSKGIGSAHFQLIDPIGSRGFGDIQNMPSIIYPFLYQRDYPTLEEALEAIRVGDANSVAVSYNCAVLPNGHYSYMGVLVSTLEGLL